MNKIFVENITNNNNLYLKEDTTLVFENIIGDIKITAKGEIKIFIMMVSSNIGIDYSTSYNTELNIFTVDSTCFVNIDLTKDNLMFNYFYSTINDSNNEYEVSINHLGNNITSLITNHGINTTNSKLEFIVNTVVPKKYIGIKTSQDSKIIVLKDNNSTIKPNLLIDNDDIEANHAAYIGKFNEKEIFYLMSRGISREDATSLLIKSFLIGNMNISFEERNMILEKINEYWR